MGSVQLDSQNRSRLFDHGPCVGHPAFRATQPGSQLGVQLVTDCKEPRFGVQGTLPATRTAWRQNGDRILTAFSIFGLSTTASRLPQSVFHFLPSKDATQTIAAPTGVDCSRDTNTFKSESGIGVSLGLKISRLIYVYQPLLGFWGLGMFHKLYFS